MSDDALACSRQPVHRPASMPDPLSVPFVQPYRWVCLWSLHARHRSVRVVVRTFSQRPVLAFVSVPRQPAWVFLLAAVAYPLPAAAYPRPAQTCHRHGDDGDHPGCGDCAMTAWVRSCPHRLDQAAAVSVSVFVDRPSELACDANRSSWTPFWQVPSLTRFSSARACAAHPDRRYRDDWIAASGDRGFAAPSSCDVAGCSSCRRRHRPRRVRRLTR